MKFGVREICDVVLKAKSTQKIGNKIFYKGEPVIYFDTLKTSTVEGAATTVYAQGGRGNARLVSWEGERTVTFTMEDALISAEGFAILSGAGLVEPKGNSTIKVHVTEKIDVDAYDDEGSEKLIEQNGTTSITIRLKKKPYLPDTSRDDYAYVMFMKDGEIITEPYIPVHEDIDADDQEFYKITVNGESRSRGAAGESKSTYAYSLDDDGLPAVGTYDTVLVDYYTEKTEGQAQQIEITADKFGGNYYLEASTLFRNQDGVDLPAEFIIPNCDIQSNFTFTMASSGDPSTFTFTMDAFPDYTRFDHSKKVLAAIQVIEPSSELDLFRTRTDHATSHERLLERYTSY